MIQDKKWRLHVVIQDKKWQLGLWLYKVEIIIASFPRRVFSKRPGNEARQKWQGRLWLYKVEKRVKACHWHMQSLKPKSMHKGNIIQQKGSIHAKIQNACIHAQRMYVCHTDYYFPEIINYSQLGITSSRSSHAFVQSQPQKLQLIAMHTKQYLQP